MLTNSIEPVDLLAERLKLESFRQKYRNISFK
jgi:hypothetical protein